MTFNTPSPYSVEMIIGFGGLEHKHSVYLDLVSLPSAGTPFADIGVKRRGGTNSPLDEVIEEYIDQLKVFYAPSATVGSPTLYAWTNELTPVRTWLSAHNYSVAGTAGGTNNYGRQLTMSFRTYEGGIRRVILLETPFTGDFIKTYPTDNSILNNFGTYCTQENTWQLGRDTAYLLAPVKAAETQNEKIYRLRFR